jgi:trehalose synthase
MWKAKPVIGGNVGGIPVQITDGKNGFLVDPADYSVCARRVVELLKDSDLNKKIGREAHRSAGHTFLITRLLRDYLIILGQLFE